MASKSTTPRPPPRTSSFNLEAELAALEKLTRPEEIEAKAKRLRDDLVTEWNKGKDKRDSSLIETQLALSKVLLTKMRYLPLTQTSSDGNRDMHIARDILEIGVWFSIAKCERRTCNPEAIKEFERNISQLKHYYFDMRPYLKESDHMYEILGMNLLNLLSQYRIADFHRELELFVHPNVDVVLENPYIKKAVEIEQYIMEGQYNKIYALKGAKAEDLKKAGLTAAGYKYFIDHLETTLKEHTSEIASVLGAAYEKVSMNDAMRLLNLKDPAKLNDIIKAQKWTVKEGYIYFHAKKDNNDAIPAESVIKNVLAYADELELIV